MPGNSITLHELERHLWEAAHIITGPIDASDYKTYIFPILFFKRVCDVYEEEFAEALKFYKDEDLARAPEQHRIQVPVGCHWRDVMTATVDVGKVLNAVMDLRKEGAGNSHEKHEKAQKDWRTVKLYGQEVNLLTSAIARMNMFLHDIEEFDIQRGDTLSDPKFLERDRLKRFDVIFANPPYSIKKWDRSKFSADPYERNTYGVPPQGCADYAFFQHIIQSLNPKTGRAAMLWPHGVLFRDSEQEIRRQVIEADLIEAVIGLGPNLFYNSPMESCVVVLRCKKSKDRKNKILFINGVKEVTRERAFSFLNDGNLETLVDAYFHPEQHEDIARLVDLSEVRDNLHNLSIPLYVHNGRKDEEQSLASVIEAWQVGRVELKKQSKKLFQALEELGFGV